MGYILHFSFEYHKYAFPACPISSWLCDHCFKTSLLCKTCFITPVRNKIPKSVNLSLFYASRIFPSPVLQKKINTHRCILTNIMSQNLGTSRVFLLPVGYVIDQSINHNPFIRGFVLCNLLPCVGLQLLAPEALPLPHDDAAATGVTGKC